MRSYKTTNSPIGQLTIQATDKGLTGLWLEQYTTKPKDLGSYQTDHPILRLAEQELDAYFRGALTVFSVPLDARGTDFQKQIWQQLSRIEFGQTLSYQDVANAIGNPKAVRAVGMANGKNPISIIVPCHRVIGKSGKLTGYAGGLEAKQWLLAHEGIL